MATPLELIKAIVTVVDTIQKVVEEVQCNKARCRRLRERVYGIVPIVKKLETNISASQNLDQPDYTNALQQMLDCLREAQEYMETFTSHKGFKASIMKVAGRDEIKRRFEGFNEKLTDLVPVLTMGMQVEAQSQLAILSDKVKLKQEDDEDEKKDWEEIMKIIKDLKGLPDQVDKVSTDIAQLTKEVRKGFDQQKRKYEDMQSTADLKLEPIEEDNLTDLTEIGKGRFGKVYKGKWIQKQIPVAVKMMDKSNSFNHEEVAGNLRDEATQMKKVETENVVRVWGMGTRSQRILLVLEFMEKGPLRDVLQNKDIELPWARRVRMALEAARGLHAIHNARPNMLHRNISSKKFLVDEDLHVKITGFGFTKTLYSARKASPLKGSQDQGIKYIAPEQLKHFSNYDQKNEIFAFGIVMWEIAMRKEPYEDKETKAIEDMIRNKEREEIPSESGCPVNFHEVINQCRNDDPILRPQTVEIIRKLQPDKQDSHFKNA